MRAFAILLAACLTLPQASYSQVNSANTPAKKAASENNGAAAPKPAPMPRPYLPSFAHLNGKIIVFTADGSGGSDELSENLRTEVGEAHVPVCVQRVRWSRNDAEVLRDHVDHEAQLRAARGLACVIIAIRRDAPKAYINLVGFSSGTRVMLAAADMLPPDSVDRIFLLASGVSTYYDLRGALRASKGGIDNFYSVDDGVLEMMEDYVGTADGTRDPSAGRVGFYVPRFAPGKDGKPSADCVLYRKLRQMRWHDDLGAETGQGGHSSWTEPGSLRRFIIPQFFLIPRS